MGGKVIISTGKDSSLQAVMGRGWSTWRLRHANKDQEASEESTNNGRWVHGEMQLGK